MIKALDAVVLIVKDIKKQRYFYKEILGLELEADYGDAVFFKAGEQKLALFSREHHKEGTAHLEGAQKGISHLEFKIEKKDEQAIQKKLKEQGFLAYGDNYQDADGNIFHFNLQND